MLEIELHHELVKVGASVEAAALLVGAVSARDGEMVVVLSGGQLVTDGGVRCPSRGDVIGFHGPRRFRFVIENAVLSEAVILLSGVEMMEEAYSQSPKNDWHVYGEPLLLRRTGDAWSAYAPVMLRTMATGVHRWPEYGESCGAEDGGTLHMSSVLRLLPELRMRARDRWRERVARRIAPWLT